MRTLRQLWAAFDDRTGLSAVIGPVMKHPVPRTRGWRAWMYVFGSATLFSFIVTVVSGIPLASLYIPATGQAYQSIQWITHGAFLGNQIRALHWWGAVAMMICIGLHLLRVFLSGAYKFPREVNWLSGVVLLFLTLGIVFTGQIVRWDQYGVWTVAIAAFQAVRTPFIGNWLAHLIVGGDTFNGTTLSRFFALHVFILPGLLVAIIGFHLYMVIRAGISEPPQSGRPVAPDAYRPWYRDLLKREGVPFWPDVAWRDAVFGTAVITAIAAAAILYGPPQLVGPPDPSNVNVVPQPDFFFLWYYAALELLPAGLENYVIILAPLIVVAILVLLPLLGNEGERSPLRRPWALVIASLAVLMIASLSVTGSIAPWTPQFSPRALPARVIGTTRGPVYDGALVWHQHGCEDCHQIAGYGGIRGPNLTNVGGRLPIDQITIRILNGGDNMPAYGGILTPTQVSELVAFLQSRKASTSAHSGRHGQASGISGKTKT